MSNKFLEKDLEQWAVDNFAEFSQHLARGSDMELIGTQVDCQVGIIDMLAASSRHLFIVEFKSKKATEKDMGQLMRYVGCTIDHIYGRLLSSPIYGFIQPVLVAPEFDKDAMYGHCKLVRVRPCGNGFSFQTINNSQYECQDKYREFSDLLRPHVEAWALSCELWKKAKELREQGFLWEN